MGRKLTARRIAAALAGASFSLLGPLPLPLPLPTPAPLAPITGSGGTTRPASGTGPGSPPPPRPSRSPPSRCAGETAAGPVAFAASVFPCDFPDPMVLRSGATWFAYGSSTGWEQDGRAFPILTSTDLRHWHDAGDALPSPPAWTNGDLWGPSVVRRQGRYLLFYNARQRGSGLHCLAVAVAAGPAGPFTGGRRLACRARGERGFIDPAPLLAARHRLYLVFSVDAPRHVLAALRLSADGLHARGRPRTLLRFSPRWGALRSRTVEGPWPLRRHGFSYLFYSTGSWSSDYRMSYAVSRSPLGPYHDAAPVPIVGPSATLTAPGGGSVLGGPRGSTWLAFAAWSGLPGYTLGSERTLRMAPLRFTARGVPQVVLSGGSASALLSAVGAAVLTPTRSCPVACS